MMIQLRCDVRVRTPAGNFVTAKADSFVNYSCKRVDNVWVHRFTYMIPRTSTICTHIETTAVGNPSWL